MYWHIVVNGTRADNIYADTKMEAELIARIQYGLTASIEITELVPEPVAQRDQRDDYEYGEFQLD